MASRVCIIRNPVSGRGSGTRRWPEVEAELRRHRERADVVATTGPGTAAGLVARAVAGGAEVIVAAGGDGTLNEVLQGIVGTSAALGLIPLGTGNDFARALTGCRTIADAVETALEGEPRRIDLGCWECGGLQGYFINVAGCGFDGTVADRVNRGFRYLHGAAAYTAAVLQSLISYRAATMLLRIDGIDSEDRAMLCAVANATSYGGGMRIAPGALFDDGLFDVVTVGEVSRTAFIRSFPSVFRGTHLAHPRVSVRHGRQIAIEATPALPVLVDGEIVGVTPARFELLPKAVPIMMPRIEGELDR